MSDESPDGNGIVPGTVDSTYDWETMAPSTAIVETVAATIDEPALEMPPLFDRIDPDALDSLVTGGFSESNGATVGTITFEYAETRVKVTGQGRVVVEPEPILT